MKLPYRNIKLMLFCVFVCISEMFAVVPAGYYYYARNKSKSELKTALKNVSSPIQVLEYGSGPGYTWQGFFFTDLRSDSTVVDMYSNIVRKQTSFAAVNGMHIEHSFPKSWWGGFENMAYKDLFHLYPADGITNSTKNNLPLGEVLGTPAFDNGVSKIGKNGFGTVYSDNCFEPSDEYKGDFARSYFYISTIYEDLSTLWQSPMLNNNTYPVWKPWARELLLKWHRRDPVSAKEIDRNEAVFKIQKNRNPFIDFPDLAEYIWGADTMNIFPFPGESQAFLTSPRRGSFVNFGIIMTNSSTHSKLRFEAVNLSGDVGLALKRNTNSLRLSASTVSAQDLTVGTDIDVFFEPITDGIVRDTLVVSGGGLSPNFEIPIVANSVSDFISLEPTEVSPVGGRLRWIANPVATDYKLALLQSEQKAGDLIISSYVEGSSWNKAVEIYNGTGKSIDLSKYTLRKQSNGDGAFGTVLKLNGLLQSGTTYTIVHKSATNATLLSKYNLLTDSLLQINGNDAIELTHSGLVVDMVGEANAGANRVWGLDLSLQRKSIVTHPVSTFNMDEWNILPTDSVAYLGSHVMSFTGSQSAIVNQVNTGNNTFFDVSNLMPGARYTYYVEAINPNQNIETINTAQLITKKLSPPEILPVDSVKTNSFIIRWEKDIYADSYYADVFSLGGVAETTSTEAFDNVGTGGIPLPSGWSSSQISIYTSTASSGLAIPSMQLNDNADWLSTKIYDAPVTKFSFMYRFPSGATGSSFTLDASQLGQWVPITTINSANTSKTTPVFNFTASQNYRQFRFTYNKTSGNLAIDDVKATYGSPDTTYVVKDRLVTENFLTVSSLQENSVYFYRLKSALGSSRSVYSDVMEQKTAVFTSNNVSGENKYFIENYQDAIVIRNTLYNDVVSLYDISGRLMFNQTSKSNQLKINLSDNGVYILHIQSSIGANTIKILH